MGLLTAYFVLGGGFLCAMIVPGEGFAFFESCPGGLSRWESFGEIDSPINLTDLSRFDKLNIVDLSSSAFG